MSGGLKVTSNKLCKHVSNVFLFFLSFSFIQFFGILATANEQLGVFPDCREKKVTIKEIIEIAKKVHSSPTQNTMVDFLSQIPKGSLQTFTFVHSTKSLQHHLVNEQWPRVLRISADGKISMSFVCNPKSQDYGSVEILFFEENPIATWRTLSLNFGKAMFDFKGIREETNLKIKFDDPECIKCHRTTSYKFGGTTERIRPIFASYPLWQGFYGSEDDTLYKNEKEYSQFKQFESFAKTDPCFQTLPWPKTKDKIYEDYPYHSLDRKNNSPIVEEYDSYFKKVKISNYHLRTNLKFTDSLSHLNAIRISHLFLQKREYVQLSPLIAMETFQCAKFDWKSEIKQQLKKFKSPITQDFQYFNDVSSMDPRSPESRTLMLYFLGLALGITADEWTLNFNQPFNPEFATGIHGSLNRDTSTARIVQGLLMKELIKYSPELEKKFKLSRGVSDFFKGQDFSCVDNLGGEIEFEPENQEKICQLLEDIYKNGKLRKIRPLEINSKSSDYEKYGFNSNDLEKGLKKNDKKDAILADFVKRSKERIQKSEPLGQEYVKTYCSNCHGADSYLPEIFHFWKTEESFISRLKKEPLFLIKALAYLESGRMPLGFEIDDKKRLAIQNYILSLGEK